MPEPAKEGSDGSKKWTDASLKAGKKKKLYKGRGVYHQRCPVHNDQQYAKSGAERGIGRRENGVVVGKGKKLALD